MDSNSDSHIFSLDASKVTWARFDERTYVITNVSHSSLRHEAMF